MNFRKQFILLIGTCLLALGAFAQVTPVKPFKAPALHTSMHKYKDSTTISYLEMKRIADFPLVVTDSANKKYRISSYQVIYRRLGVTENEKTGKISPAYTFASGRFTETPLPPIWVKSIKEDCKPTEYIHFFDIIVKDDQNRLMFAKDLFIKLR